MTLGGPQVLGFCLVCAGRGRGYGSGGCPLLLRLGYTALNEAGRFSNVCRLRVSTGTFFVGGASPLCRRGIGSSNPPPSSPARTRKLSATPLPSHPVFELPFSVRGTDVIASHSLSHFRLFSLSSTLAGTSVLALIGFRSPCFTFMSGRSGKGTGWNVFGGNRGASGHTFGAKWDESVMFLIRCQRTLPLCP